MGYYIGSASGGDIPWYQVEIAESYVADNSASALMDAFGAAYQYALSSGPVSEDVRVYHGKSVEGGHIYYFSPGASDLAQELLQQWNAVACSEEPDLRNLTPVGI